VGSRAAAVDSPWVDRTKAFAGAEGRSVKLRRCLEKQTAGLPRPSDDERQRGREHAELVSTARPRATEGLRDRVIHDLAKAARMGGSEFLVACEWGSRFRRVALSAVWRSGR